jgi:ABC-type uncharacterized transport system permease subunit
MHYEVGFYLLSTIFLLYWLYQPQNRTAKRLGLLFLGLGFLTFLGSTTLNLLNGTPPALNVPRLVANTAVAIFYLTLIKFRKLNAVKFAPVISAFALTFTLFGLNEEPLNHPNLTLTLHIITSILSYSLLLLSAVVSLFKLLAEAKLKKGNIALPLGVPLTLWVNLERKFFFFGFVLLTVNLVLGFLLMSLYAENPKFDLQVSATLLIWIYYGLIFHLERFGIEPFKSKFAVFNIVGALIVVYTLLFIKHSFKNG